MEPNGSSLSVTAQHLTCDSRLKQRLSGNIQSLTSGILTD